MDENDPEIRVFLALAHIQRIKAQLEDMQKDLSDALKGLQERKPKQKRSKKDGS